MNGSYNTSIVKIMEEYIPPVAADSIGDSGNMQGVTNSAKPSVAAFGEMRSATSSTASSRRLEGKKSVDFSGEKKEKKTRTNHFLIHRIRMFLVY